MVARSPGRTPRRAGRGCTSARAASRCARMSRAALCVGQADGRSRNGRAWPPAIPTAWAQPPSSATPNTATSGVGVRAPGARLGSAAFFRYTGPFIVVDDLDVVAIRVEHEGAVVPGVVHGALAGPTVVLIARGERRGVEVPHRGVRVRWEGEVDVLGERPIVAHERERKIGAGEPHAIRRVVREAEPGVRRDRPVEAQRPLRVANAEPQVVDAAVGHGVLAVAMDSLDTVSI